MIPTGFDGLEKRITGGQLIKAGTSVGGDVLTLDKLDELLDAVPGCDVLVMNRAMRRKINKLIRAAGQATEVVSDAFGRPVQAYASVPFAILDVDHTGTEILGFTEDDATDAAAACTSIYAVKFGAKEYVSGLQCGDFGVEDCGKLPGTNKMRTKIDWMAGLAVFNPKVAGRLYPVKNA